MLAASSSGETDSCNCRSDAFLSDEYHRFHQRLFSAVATVKSGHIGSYLHSEVAKHLVMSQLHEMTLEWRRTIPIQSKSCLSEQTSQFVKLLGA